MKRRELLLQPEEIQNERTGRRRKTKTNDPPPPRRTSEQSSLGRLLRAVPGIIQARLKIGAPGDKYEQEADRVADRVMGTPDRGDRVADRTLQNAPSGDSPEKIQRSPDSLPEIDEDDTEEGLIQEKSAGPAAPAVSSHAARNIRSATQGGRPLTITEREFFEPRFGADFSGVRLHTDAQAAQSARSLNARAYTLGKDIAFNAGEYSPESTAGRRLLAHELTHVLQQNHDVVRRQPETEEQIPETRFAGAAGPAPLAPAGPAVLTNGQVVDVEIRNGGKISKLSHEYPIDLQGNIEIPVIGHVKAAGKSPPQLRQDIHKLLSGVMRNVTTNVNLSKKTVNYAHKLAAGETVYLRILYYDGRTDPSSGSYKVDSNGKLHLPHVGSVNAAGVTLAALENQLEKGYRGYLRNVVVYLTLTQLNS